MSTDKKPQTESVIVPVGGLMLACALMFAVMASHSPDWIAYVIFVAWWVVFGLWYKKR